MSELGEDRYLDSSFRCKGEQGRRMGLRRGISGKDSSPQNVQLEIFYGVLSCFTRAISAEVDGYLGESKTRRDRRPERMAALSIPPGSPHASSPVIPLHPQQEPLAHRPISGERAAISQTRMETAPPSPTHLCQEGV